MTPLSNSKKLKPDSPIDSIDFESWMKVLDKKSLSIQDQALFLTGLQDNPDWVKHASSSQQNPLIKASKGGHVEVLKALIQAGADVKFQDFLNRTALMWASEGKQEEAVKVLAQAGADLNVQDEYGWTALMNASRQGELAIVQHLIHHGADPEKKNKDKKTAMDLAQEQGHEKVVKLLEAYIAIKALSQVIQPLKMTSSFDPLKKKNKDPLSKSPRL